MRVEELGRRPRLVPAGGGLPAVGRDDAHQAGEAHGHKRHGTRDTVRFPVKVKPMRCTFDLCTYNATAHWTGTQEELLFVLEEHVSTDHPLHTAELVNGYVTRGAWNTFRDWWSDYADMLTYREQVYGSKKDIRDYLSTFVGEAGGLVLQELGLDKFMALTGPQMLKETERIAVKGEARDNDRRPFELPSGCNTPHFKSHELVGTKGAQFRKRLGEQKQQFALTDREMVRLLWRACKPHPKIQHQLRETLGCGWIDQPIYKLCNMGSDWVWGAWRGSPYPRGSRSSPPCRSLRTSL